MTSTPAFDTTSTAPGWAREDTDLSGRTVLFIGGTGGVGEGALRSLLAAGASVVATGRSPARLADLAVRTASPALHTAVLDTLAPDLDEAVDRMIVEHGRPDAAVVSIASWGRQGRKPVLSLTDGEWDRLIADNQTAVFRLYRTLVPRLPAGGALVQLNGLSAEIPFPGAAGVALTAAATKSLTRTLATEVGERGPRVYEVVLGVVRTRARQLAGIDDERWIDGSEIGVHLAELVAGTSPLRHEVLHYFVDKASGPQASLARTDTLDR